MKIIDLGLIFGNLSYRSSTKRIILHHADGQECGAQLIHQWHKQNGWAGCGYHFVVRKDGTIERGRPEGAIGAHAMCANADSIGICFEGDYDIENKMPDKQKNAGKMLVAYLKDKYKITNVQRHKDVTVTACPGKYFPFDEIAGATVALDTNIKAENVQQQEDYVNGIARLQAECNKQGFSSQKVDGIAGPITLAGCPVLKKGATGNITKWLQTTLNTAGYNCGPVDGIFGDNTKKGVIAYQKAHGLTIDGIVGTKTWSKLLGLS